MVDAGADVPVENLVRKNAEREKRAEKTFSGKGENHRVVHIVQEIGTEHRRRCLGGTLRGGRHYQSPQSVFLPQCPRKTEKREER